MQCLCIGSCRNYDRDVLQTVHFEFSLVSFRADFIFGVQEVLDTDDVGESQCFQYLVNIEFNKEGFPGFSSSGGLGAVLERLQKYFDETKGKKTGTWVSGARIARKSALVENWPSVLQGWKDKYVPAPPCQLFMQR